MNFSLEKKDDIREFTAGQWDSFHKGGFYLLHSFLCAVQEAGVNDASYEYIVVKDGDRAVGIAVLSSFILQLDLLAGQSKIVTRLKKMFPRVFRLRVACCGIPVSFGQNHFYVAEPALETTVLELVELELASFCLSSGSKMVAWKEFSNDFKASERLTDKGYIKLKSLPDMVVSNVSGSYPDFINSLRSSHRRKFKRTQENVYSENAAGESFTLEVQQYSSAHAQEFYKGYLAVISRTDVKLEVYSRAFFDLLAFHSGHFIKILSVANNKNEKLSALLVQQEKEMHFILVAKEKKIYSDPLYNELLLAILIYGLQKGCEIIHLGQTSYYSKMDCGALPVPLYIYLRSDRKYIQFILKFMGDLLFPDTKLPHMQAYKQYA